MDFLQELGPLALASRLRRLTERLTQDIAQIYRTMDIDFEPRWFPVFYLLSQKGPLGVVDIARMLNISHPAVNQIAGELIQQGLLESLRDETDKRKRLLTLTSSGYANLPVLSKVWSGIYTAIQTLLDETDPKLLTAVDSLEQSLDRQSIAKRFVATMQLDLISPPDNADKTHPTPELAQVTQ